MVIMVLGAIRVGTEIMQIRQAYEQFLAQAPALRGAVSVYSWLLFGSACSALYLVWVLYGRNPGTLPLAKRALVFTIILRIAAPWHFYLFAGLPYMTRQEMRSQVLFGGLALAAYGTVWYLYLSYSKRVREMFAEHLVGYEETSDLASPAAK